MRTMIRERRSFRSRSRLTVCCVLLLVTSLVFQGHTAEPAEAQVIEAPEVLVADFTRFIPVFYPYFPLPLSFLYSQLEDKIAELGPGIVDYCNPLTEDGLSVIQELQEMGDCIGMLPVVGLPVDVANALVSFGQGQWADGAIRMVAVVPVVGAGSAAAKITLRAVKAGGKTKKTITVKAIKDITNHTKVPAKSVASTLDTSPFRRVDVKVTPFKLRPKRYAVTKLRPQLLAEAGIPAKWHHLYDIDHIIALSLGGTNKLENLIVVTKVVNSQKASIERAVGAAIRNLKKRKNRC